VKDEGLHQSSAVPATNALKELWGLQEGELYIVKDGELKHLPRSDDDLPKVPVSEAARDALLQVRRKCRKALGGFRPDLALVTSALVLYACEREPIAIVVGHFHEVMPAVPADER
jgi:hypothetical protein